MKVRDLMTTEIIACSPHDDLATAARIMWERDCGCVPVVDDDGRAIAVITDRDVCMAAYTQGRSLHETSVASAMSRNLRTCRVDDDVADVEETMRAEQVRRLPVVEVDGSLAGILSLNDIARRAVYDRPLLDKQVTFDEVGTTLASVSGHRLRRDEALVPVVG